MGDREQLIEVSDRLAAAIGRRDVRAIRPMLAKGFVHRAPGGEPVETSGWVAAVITVSFQL